MPRAALLCWGWQTPTRPSVQWTRILFHQLELSLGSPTHVFSPCPFPLPQLCTKPCVLQLLQPNLCLTLEVKARLQQAVNHTWRSQILVLFISTRVELDVPEAELLCLVISHPHFKTIKTRVAQQLSEGSYPAGQWREYSSWVKQCPVIATWSFRTRGSSLDSAPLWLGSASAEMMQS